MTADFEQRDLKGRHVVISGASKGIGKRLAEKLNELGAHLFLIARNKDGDLDQVVESLKKTNKHVYGYTCDQSKREEIISTFKKIGEQTDHIDVLVCNASIMPGYGIGIEDLSDELDEATFRTNIDGYHFCTKYALPLLSKSKDFDRTIIYVSSMAGWLSRPIGAVGMVSYCISKAAENGLMAAIYNNYVSDDDKVRKPDQKLHRVASLHPGFVATTLGSETWENKELEMASTKLGMGAISIEEGTDTLYWLVTAKDGVESGKHYYQRKVIPF